MLNKLDLKRIVKALPHNGYQLIADKVDGVSVETIRKILSEPRRYRKDVIDASITVIDEHQYSLAKQKEKIRQITA